MWLLLWFLAPPAAKSWQRAWQEVITAAITIALLIQCGIYTLWMYTNTGRSIKAEQRLGSEVLTSEVGLLHNFRAYKKRIPFI